MHGKRQVKSPKVLIRDSGMLHALLGCGTARELRDHPKYGASWEGYALERVIQRVLPDEAFFWPRRAERSLISCWFTRETVRTSCRTAFRFVR